MIQQSPHASVRPFGKAANVFVVMGVTPKSRWERVLPLLERAGFGSPQAAIVQRWVAAVREATPIGRPDIATLKPMSVNPVLRAATDELFAACKTPVSIAIASDHADEVAEFWEREIPGAHFLFVHGRPEKSLIEAMRDGVDPITALQCWIDAAVRVLEFYRRNRNRVTMVDVDSALADIAEFTRVCRADAVSDISGNARDLVLTVPEDRGVVGLIAAQAVFQSGEARRLITELEACSLPFDGLQGGGIDCTQIFKQLGYQRCQLDDAVRERNEAVSALAAVQDTLAEREAALRASEARIEAELISARDRQAEMYEARIGQIEKGRAEQAALVASREADIDRLRLSLATSETRNMQAKQENELLLLQLQQVQEELESYYLQFQSAKVHLRKRDEELERARERLAKTDEKLGKADEMLSLVKRKLAYRDRRLQYLQNSLSWKMTAPVRTVFGLLFRRQLVRGAGDAS